MAERIPRSLVMGLLVVGLVGMMIHYGAVMDRDQSLSEPQSVLDNWDAHTGEPVYLWAQVRAVESDQVEIRAGQTRLIVTGAVTGASPGDVIQVYGTALPNHRIAPQRTIVSDATGQRYMYAVSGLAVLLTAAFFFRQWQFDWHEHRIRQREEENA